MYTKNLNLFLLIILVLFTSKNYPVNIPNISATSDICPISENNILSLLNKIKSEGQLQFMDLTDATAKKISGGGGYNIGLIGIKLSSDKTNKPYTYIVKLMDGNNSTVQHELTDFAKIQEGLADYLKKYSINNQGEDYKFALSIPAASFYINCPGKKYAISILEYASGILLMNRSGTDVMNSKPKEEVIKALYSAGQALGNFHFNNRKKRDKVNGDFIYETLTHRDFHGENILTDPNKDYQMTFIDNAEIVKSLDKGRSPIEDLIYFYGMHTVGTSFSKPKNRFSDKEWHEIISNFFKGWIEAHPEGKYRDFAKEYVQYIVSPENLNKTLEIVRPVSGWNYHIKRPGKENKLKELIKDYNVLTGERVYPISIVIQD